MDALRFDRFVRSLFAGQTRRTMLGLGGVGLLAALGLDDADAKKHKKKKKSKKKCGPCAKCKKGKCKPAKAAGTPCGEGRQCFANGQCVACDVCASGCPFSSVQAALGDVAEDTTIQVCPGIYPTIINPLIIRGVTVIGAGTGPGGTFLVSQNMDHVVLLRSGDQLEMRALTITGTRNRSGIDIFRARLTLEDVHVADNHTTLDGGGIWAGESELTLIRTRVSGNSAANGGGIYNRKGELRLTADSVVTGNSATSGAGGIHNADGGTVGITGGSRVIDNEPDDCAGTTAC